MSGIVLDIINRMILRRALTYLFDCLKQYGGEYSKRFWSVVCNEVIFPIFEVLKPDGRRKYENSDDMSEWLSTTLVQSLRSFVDLFTHFFETISFMLDSILEIFVTCINQENETLARIGTSCLQQLVESNYTKLDEEMWDHICGTFEKLFKATTPQSLFVLFDAAAEGSHGSLARVSSRVLNETEGGNIV